MAASFQEGVYKSEYSKRKEMEAARPFKPELEGPPVSFLVRTSQSQGPSGFKRRRKKLYLLMAAQHGPTGREHIVRGHLCKLATRLG